jgi:hypothetical protein
MWIGIGIHADWLSEMVRKQLLFIVSETSIQLFTIKHVAPIRSHWRMGLQCVAYT